MQWYAHQVANHPSLLILLVLSAAGTCIIISLTTSELPSLKDPILGFEPRGTELASRATAWQNLLESTNFLGPLSNTPENKKNSVKINLGNFTARSEPLLGESVMDRDYGELVISANETTTSAEPGGDKGEGLWGTLEKLDREENGVPRISSQPQRQVIEPAGDEHFFCNDPGRAYAHIIFQSSSDKNLFSLPALSSVCRIGEIQLKESSHYESLCEYNSRRNRCCRSWSLPNYVALLSGRPSCHAITNEDIASVLELLQSCARYYHGLKLSHDCTTDPALCHGVPLQCTKYNAVYNILHYLTDANFFNPEEGYANSTFLTYTSIFLPIAQSTSTMDYYKDLSRMKIEDGDVKIGGMQMGLKHALFEEYLIHDTFYVGLAGCVIFIFIWMYTASFFVTLMTVLAIAFSLAISYFMYVTVFSIRFFPFMNLLTVIIAIGIGADDAFLYCKIWVCAKAEKNNGTLVKLVKDTLHHACLSMFVTSVTTSAAFFCSFISSITAVRCFRSHAVTAFGTMLTSTRVYLFFSTRGSIFAGTAALANFLFTVTCLPASVIISEKWCSMTCCLCIPPFGIYLPPIQRLKCCTSFCNALWKTHFSFVDSARVFFEKILPCLVIRPRYFWLVLFGGLALGASVAVFYYPKLRLPDTKDFQIFGSSHPFERYDMILKKEFWFEKAKERDYSHNLPLRIVWGVLPVDNGNYLNPFDRGTMRYDPTFNVSTPAAQSWLLSFCKELRNQSFYQSTIGALLHNCFIETMKGFMERRCVDGITKYNRTPCCQTSKFPYKPRVFNQCIGEAVNLLHKTPGLFTPGVAGPRFERNTGNVKVIVVEYDSTFTYTNSYTDMNRFKTEVDTWVKGMMATAPPEMRNGWFISDLEFFDLQDSLAKGTLVAIGVAVGVSFLALLVTTLNLLISLYAILTIACIIMVTVGTLVLLGWKLNILESITVSVAIGLAVDFTLHYGIAYRLSSQEDRDSSVIHSLSKIGSPVAMGAFTTFVAGALMFSSAVLAYLQIGIFLVLVTTVSWLYATFFFQSLLSLLGPQNGQLQLRYPSFEGCCNSCCEVTSNAIPFDKPAYALSESTLSTSSASCPAITQLPSNETHELEPLTVTSSRGADLVKYVKKHHGHRTRSGSFTAPTRRLDPNVLVKGHSNSLVVSGQRKISLPAVNVTFHGESSPPDMTANSSTSVMDEERDMSCSDHCGGDDARAKQSLIGQESSVYIVNYNNRS